MEKWLNKSPMGWNSFDYYNTSVTEADVKANADYMAKHLKGFGWEYIVVKRVKSAIISHIYPLQR